MRASVLRCCPFVSLYKRRQSSIIASKKDFLKVFGFVNFARFQRPNDTLLKTLGLLLGSPNLWSKRCALRAGYLLCSLCHGFHSVWVHRQAE